MAMTAELSMLFAAPDVEWQLPPVTGEGLLWGAGALVVGFLLGRLGKLAVRALMRWRGRGDSSAEVFGRLTSWVWGTLGVAAALTIIFPSVKPVDVLGGVGVISIAAGIAFQTVLGNMFAGIVLLARDRFRVGDQIAVDEYSGTVTGTRLTSTSLRTFDGRLVLIPNAVMHSQIVTVQTGFEAVRTTVALDLDETTDLDRARRIAEQVMLALPEVIDVPAPEALLASIGTATVSLELRFWSGALQLETRHARHAVIRGVLAAFADQGIVTGSDIHVFEAGPQLASTLSRIASGITASAPSAPPVGSRPATAAAADDTPRERD